MASNTYVALSTQTLASTTSSVTFSSISSAYTDLILVATGTGTNTIDLSFRVNGDTGANYSRTVLYGSGTAAGSTRNSGLTFGRLTYYGPWTTSNPSTVTAHFMNYSNSTTYKTVLCRDGNGATGVSATVDLWRSTSPITSIEVYTSSDSFASGSTFTLYGIAAASAGAKATGGIIYADSTYYYHVFLNSGTFTASQSLSADVLVVAGGAGGGYIGGGGGGAGGLCYQSSRSISATSYTVTVGAGGAGGVNDGNAGTAGSNSVLDTITALGGGGGANAGAGLSGGSGGGAGWQATYSGGATTQVNSGGATGYGNAGGANSIGAGAPNYATAGGGGAGAVGGNTVSSTTAGAGGVGLTYTTIAALDLFGAATNTGQLSNGHYYYAGGGGGSSGSVNGAGGLGGGATGSSGGRNAGTANTGGGGGGGGGTGGSGLVIVRYAK